MYNKYGGLIIKNIWVNKIKDFDVYFDEEKAVIFENHICELINRIRDNNHLEMKFEDWMSEQVSNNSMEISEKFLNKNFPETNFYKIEIFLIATHIELAKGEKNE